MNALGAAYGSQEFSPLPSRQDKCEVRAVQLSPGGSSAPCCTSSSCNKHLPPPISFPLTLFASVFCAAQ